MDRANDQSDFGDARHASAAQRPMLFGRYEIDTSEPLAGLSRPGARAYAAVDVNEPSRSIYAIVTDPRLPVRMRAYHQVRAVQHPAFTQPLRIDSVEWPPSGRRETALILPRPSGLPLMANLDEKIEPISLYRLTRNIMPLLAEMLGEMDACRVAHRTIRPDNIYADGNKDMLTVGECFSVPAGMAQPAIFEPLERAMCPPAARGEGDAADDMFALGVTALFLAFGYNPVGGMDPEALLMRRRQVGSYAALVGKRHVPTELVQMLRALLCDEPADRWSIADLQGWLSNGRRTPAPNTQKTECERPFLLGERKFNSAETLALGLAGDWTGALDVVRSGQIDKWLDRSLKDKRCRTALKRCRISGNDGPRTINDDLLLARTLLALDPNGPLRYRGVTVMTDGIGPYFASIFGDAVKVRTLVDMLSGLLPAFSIEQKNRPSYAMFGAEEAIKRILPMLAQQAAGFGIERVLYELNNGLVCKSPLVADAACTDVNQLLLALDASSEKASSVFDRHIAAFIAARINGSIDRDLNDISLAGPPSEKLLAQLRLFAYTQSRSDVPKLPGLCQFFLGKSKPVLDSYRNVELRNRLARAAKSAAATGELVRLEKVLGNPKNRRLDANGFSAARQQYLEFETEAGDLQQSFAAIPLRAREVGKQIGAYMACVVSLASTIFILLSQMV